MSFERKHLKLLGNRINEDRRFIQVIFGPRQVGKTTIVLQLTEKIDIPFLFISADGVLNAAWIEQQWEIARLQLKQSGAKTFLLVIDEIQKIENWSETIKKMWDADTRQKINIKLILLGSSRLLIQQGLTESLAGRFETMYIGHWTFDEMEAAFGITVQQFVWFGGYPGAAGLIKHESRWKNYIKDALIETSISKDILMLTRVDKPALMKRLFELGCLYSGQILSYTKILGQLLDAGNTTTLSHYLELLDTAGLLGGIDKFANDALRQRASSPKFQVHNTALISSQNKNTFKQITANPTEWGRVVESAVGAHLINAALVEDFKVSYWRNGNFEMDFVLERNDSVIGLEVKSGSSFRVSGVEAFKKQCNPKKVLLIGRNGLPWEDFLKINPVELF